MSDSTGYLEASMVFEKMFTDYLKSQEDAPARKLLVRKLERMSTQGGILGGMGVDEEGVVSINVREGSDFQVVEELARAFDTLIDVVAFSAGQEAAFMQAQDVVSKVMKQFQEPFNRLGIKNHILRGSMADRISSGIKGLDGILGGGFPRGEMILVSGPPGLAKHSLAYQFMAGGLSSGGAGVMAVSSMSVSDSREMLFKHGVNVTSCETKNRLRTIDWYSQRSRAVIGMEELGPVLVPSKDIANLEIAFNSAMDSLSFAPTVRAMVDIISPALNVYGLSEVVEFVQRLKSKFDSRRITSVFIVEDGVHDERVMTTLRHVSDTSISVSADDRGGLQIEVLAMSTPNFRKGKSAIQLSYRGIAVMDRALDEGGVIAEFCNIPHVTPDIARRLVDAGYTDMNQLSRADESDLLKVNTVTRDIARSIAEYTRTVEYSQSVLSNRSERWLMKAREQDGAGDVGRAVKSIERALEIDPDNATAKAELARLRGKLGNG